MEDKKNPNALAYGITPSAPASLQPVDIDTWKAEVSPTFKHYFTGRYNDLLSQYEQLVRDYEINRLCYEASLNFKPVIGHTYYLYRRGTGQAFFSMISLEESGWSGYIGKFKMNTQYAWEQL